MQQQREQSGQGRGLGKRVGRVLLNRDQQLVDVTAGRCQIPSSRVMHQDRDDPCQNLSALVARVAEAVVCQCLAEATKIRDTG